MAAKLPRRRGTGKRLRGRACFPRGERFRQCGAVAEWSKALAWKVSIRQKRIVGSNPTRSATGFPTESFADMRCEKRPRKWPAR